MISLPVKVELSYTHNKDEKCTKCQNRFLCWTSSTLSLQPIKLAVYKDAETFNDFVSFDVSFCNILVISSDIFKMYFSSHSTAVSKIHKLGVTGVIKKISWNGDIALIKGRVQ
jgi:hypothetical protein